MVSTQRVRKTVRRLRGEPVLLELDLSRGLPETPPADPLAALRTRQVPSLSAVLTALREASADPDVVGLVAHVGPDLLSAAQVQELGAGVEAFAASGRATVCWTETFGELGPGTLPYHLASWFDEVWLQPSGSVGLVGLATRGLFVRGALDRLGVEPQIGQRHEYKSAADLLMSTEMGEAYREAAQRLVDSSTDEVVRTTARRRRLDEEQVRAAIQAAPLSAGDARERGLVDRLGYRDEVYAGLRRRLGRDGALTLRYVHRWSPRGARQARRRVVERRKPVVAVVGVEGSIQLGRSGGSPLGDAWAGSDTVCAALRAAGERDDVRAVVLRVVSPGGSYVASDAIHREVLQLRETGRPVVASMGTVAASGGYFVSMPADEVVALPSTVTGSIGVLGGKVVTGDALRRVGVVTEPLGAGPRSAMVDPARRFTDDEWSWVQGWLDEVYADFTGKAAVGRRMPYDELEPRARGRVWTGADAKERGLVDTLGGLEEAVSRAAGRAGLERAAVRVQRLPRLGLLDRVRPADSSETPAAARTGMDAEALASTLLRRLGLASDGVLSLPGSYRLG